MGGDIFFKYLREKILLTMKHSKHTFCKLNWAIIRYKNYPHTNTLKWDDALTLDTHTIEKISTTTTTTIISRRWLIILIIVLKRKSAGKLSAGGFMLFLQELQSNDNCKTFLLFLLSFISLLRVHLTLKTQLFLVYNSFLNKKSKIIHLK